MKDTIRPAWLNNPYLPENRRRFTNAASLCWFTVGVLLLACDALAMAHFADGLAESLIFAALTLPTAFIVMVAGVYIRVQR